MTELEFDPILFAMAFTRRFVSLSKRTGVGIVFACMKANVAQTATARKKKYGIFLGVLYGRFMATEKPTNVRFRSDVLAKVARAAARFGIPKSSIIKFATALFADDFEKRGEAALPRDWKEIIQDLDGRTHRYAPGGTGHRVNQVGNENIGVQTNFPLPSAAPSRKAAKGKRGKKKPEK